MLKKLVVVTVVITVAALGASIPYAVPVPKGAEIVPIPVFPLEENEASVTSFTSGNVFQQTAGYQAGITTYDYQSNGAMGNRIAVDDSGDVHICWMHDDDENFVNRDIYYNVWEKSTGEFIWGSGVKASGTGKAGYTTMGLLSDGRAVVAYHHDPDGDGIYQSAVSRDAFRKTGAFSSPIDIDPVTVPEQPIWPHIVIGPDDVIHVTAHVQGGGTPYNVDYLYYSRSTDQGVTFSEWEVISDDAGSDVAMAVSGDGNKVAIVWVAGFPIEGVDWRVANGGNIKYVESTNSGESWGSPVIVTEDRYYQGTLPNNHEETGLLYCAWGSDLDCAYDTEGNLHIGYGEGLRSFEVQGEPPDDTLFFWSMHRWFLRMMHYSEVSNDFNVVSGPYTMFHYIDENGDTIWEIDTLGMWGIAQRVDGYFRPFLGCGNPQLAAKASGEMVYTWGGQWDSLDITAAGSINADLYAAISDDGGVSWGPTADWDTNHLKTYGLVFAHITNLTNTHSPGAKIGESLSEDYHSVWPWIGSDSILHINYIHDLFAGSCLHPPTENIFTENPVMYLGVKPYVGVGPDSFIDSNAVKDDLNPNNVPVIEITGQNPVGSFVNFNVSAPNTNVSLKVYDAAGSLVETLFEGRLGGTRVITWDASAMAAGVYFYSFVTPARTTNGRVVVVH